MPILKTVRRIPGGMMVVPLLLGAIVNTFFGEIWTMYDGTFTTHLWKTGAMPILAAFLFCNGTTIDFKRAGVPLGKGILLTVIKVGLGMILGILVNAVWTVSGSGNMAAQHRG